MFAGGAIEPLKLSEPESFAELFLQAKNSDKATDVIIKSLFISLVLKQMYAR